MSEELQQKLRDQLWEVANRLRGNMSATISCTSHWAFIFYLKSATIIQYTIKGRFMSR